MKRCLTLSEILAFFRLQKKKKKKKKKKKGKKKKAVNGLLKTIEL